MSPIGPRSWLVQRQHNWPADDARLRPGLEIAFAIPTSTDPRLLQSGRFLPGLLANYEMTQRSNPALSKPVNRKMPSKAALLSRTSAQRIPSSARSLCSTKAEYICADHPVTFVFRLRQSGGPYIPVGRPIGNSVILDSSPHRT